MAFQVIKKQLTSPCLLVHYNPQKELLLPCDASPYGIGAVLSHQEEDRSEKPVAFTSRSLSPAEKKYAPQDKEGLAIVFGVNKFMIICLAVSLWFTPITSHYNTHSAKHILFHHLLRKEFRDGPFPSSWWWEPYRALRSAAATATSHTSMVKSCLTTSWPIPVRLNGLVHAKEGEEGSKYTILG